MKPGLPYWFNFPRYIKQQIDRKQCLNEIETRTFFWHVNGVRKASGFVIQSGNPGRYECFK